jgi:hypothetical protein
MEFEVAVTRPFHPPNGILIVLTCAVYLALASEDHRQHEPFVGIAAFAELDRPLECLSSRVEVRIRDLLTVASGLLGTRFGR